MTSPSAPAPGSRAIKIPLNASASNEYTNPGRRRRTNLNRQVCLERTDSSDMQFSHDTWSTTSPASSTSASSSRPEGIQLQTQKTMASPSHIQMRRHSEYTVTNGTAASTTSKRKDKHRAADDDLSPPNSVPPPPLYGNHIHNSPLGPSMLSSSSYKSINLNSHLSGDPDEPARLITYTKHSQGFTWNDELFLPSYLMGRRYGGGRGHGGRRRWGGGAYDDDDDMDGVGDFDEEADRCPVTDIFVTDEEAAAMMP